MTAPDPLLPALRAAFAVEVRRALGLVFPSTRAESFEGGIVRAASALGETSAALLVRLVDGDPPAIEALALELTIGETYFFRHPHHFDFLRRSLPTLLAGRASGDPVRLWSAGCSSGEEAYSMAIAALDVLGPTAVGAVQILGTDVNVACVERARAGTYGEWSFRNVAPDVRARWFEPDGARLRVAEAPRSMVRFVARNLLEGPPFARAPDPWARGIDLIFCRNVLIYFDPAAIHAVTQSLGRALSLGGLLVPGPSDPLLRSARLTVRTAGGLITYQRPVEAETLATIAAPRVERTPTPTPTPIARVEVPRAAVLATPSILDRARRHADAGDVVAARALLDGTLSDDRLQEEAYALRALLAQGEGDHAQAAADADRAILLRSSFAFAHLIAAASRAQLGEIGEARRHLRNAQRLLAALDPDGLVVGSGGVTAGELLHSARQLGRSLAAPRVGRASGARN